MIRDYLKYKQLPMVLSQSVHKGLCTVDEWRLALVIMGFDFHSNYHTSKETPVSFRCVGSNFNDPCLSYLWLSMVLSKSVDKVLCIIDEWQ